MSLRSLSQQPAPPANRTHLVASVTCARYSSVCNKIALHTMLMMTAESVLSKRPFLRFTVALLFLLKVALFNSIQLLFPLSKTLKILSNIKMNIETEHAAKRVSVEACRLRRPKHGCITGTYTLLFKKTK